MNLDLQPMIVKATQDVFDTMIMMPISPGTPLSEQVETFHCNVSGMLGFSGDLKGMLTIHCPDAVALAITTSFLGMDVESIDDDVKDAIGELANMITGGVKDALAEVGQGIKLSVPTTIAGRSYSLSSLSDTHWVIIPFATDEGEFLVELKFKADILKSKELACHPK